MSLQSTKSNTPHTRWSIEECNSLLAQLQAATRDSNATSTSFKPSVWTSIALSFQDPLKQAGKICESRWTGIKRDFKDIKMLRESPGFEWDEETKMISGVPKAWQSVNQIFPELMKWRSTPFPWFEQVMSILGESPGSKGHTVTNAMSRDADKEENSGIGFTLLPSTRNTNTPNINTPRPNPHNANPQYINPSNINPPHTHLRSTNPRHINTLDIITSSSPKTANRPDPCFEHIKMVGEALGQKRQLKTNNCEIPSKMQKPEISDPVRIGRIKRITFTVADAIGEGSGEIEAAQASSVDSRLEGRAMKKVQKETYLTDEGKLLMIDLLAEVTAARAYLSIEAESLRHKWLKRQLLAIKEDIGDLFLD